MLKNILIVERSPLAKNVYAMILSRFREVNITDINPEEGIARFEDIARRADLVILGEVSGRYRREEYIDVLAKISKEKKVTCVIIIHCGSAANVKEHIDLRNVRVIERPFFPEELVNAVAGFWGGE